ncbi:glyoxal oxidase N-terminus-domain-containing protein [Halteromyces radiatus]|uniref:glyoxal oxidase N-terminus-domain-containing protein n=1 Tax=Halteromyces radiatus TaxID=101107 RepID=UPI00221E4A2C|nr:glyoxal oxidase N-terminus-domain-containing protein [Halteromyces radiatus]KAI8093205.1 glyoxal oxidase N-terminus-domain-containing protein [Halteromyces radiatus]
MKISPFLGLAFLANLYFSQAQDSPFAWMSSSQQVISPFAKAGKMEQRGRTGVAAMHAVLLNEKKILVIDKAEWNEAQFDSGQSAFSVEYDLTTDTYRTLPLETNTFCSAGGFLGNGSFVSTGGGERRGRTWKAEPGWQSIRHYTPCMDNLCEWSEYKTGHMTNNRWYPTVEQLPEGDIFIIGGSTKGAAVNRDEINVPSYEFWPPRGDGREIHMPFLNETMPFNLYPFVFALPDGNLFIFANRQSMIFDYNNNRVVKRLPDIPGMVRSYPLTGGAVMLPLDPANDYNVEILVCGGSENMKKNAKADATCGRINLGDEEPKWEMDTFVYPRLMPDGVILADGSILWVNGCQRGWAGYNGRNHDPTFDPIIYDSKKPHGDRWTTGLANTDIARMYHSVALTLPNGQVWIAGSNNVDPPNIDAEYPTEFRVEYYSPPYLFKSATRPLVSHVPRVVVYDQSFDILLNIGGDLVAAANGAKEVKVALLRPGFSTHSMHMSQRYVYLTHQLSDDMQSLKIQAPPRPSVFPPGAGFLIVLYNGVPSEGVEIFVENDINDLAI